MMSLDLNQKARKFKMEFDTFANMLSQSLDGDAWNEAYETQIKAFYEKEGLDKYDARALSNSFFNITSNLEMKENNNIMLVEWLYTKNYRRWTD